MQSNIRRDTLITQHDHSTHLIEYVEYKGEYDKYNAIYCGEVEQVGSHHKGGDDEVADSRNQAHGVDMHDKPQY